MTTLLPSCSSEGYDTGDGELSYLKAEFVEARTASAKMFVSATTDDGVDLTLSPALECEWATTADSTYRALLYYNIGDGNAVEPVTVSKVMVLEPHAMADGDDMKTDPVRFESAWLSNNGRYINLGLYLMTGVEDGIDSRHTIGMIMDGTGDSVTLTLYHDQGGVPEYYSSRLYVSVPVESVKEHDTVTIVVNTYEGKVTRTFPISLQAH